jgi:adenosylcobinamide kinase / adenosylcobinamide-phosphate guanylyltransferase
MNTTLILGGARSGKSRYAEQLAKTMSRQPVYLATSRAWDEDHQARIRRHQRDRGPEWITVEAELRLSATGLQDKVVVVDCVTLWLTNFFVDHKLDPETSLSAAQEELDRTLLMSNEWIFVSNEIGQGLHATTESGRKFTDIQGLFNQYLAARANRVVLMVAGIPLTIKDTAAAIKDTAAAIKDTAAAIEDTAAAIKDTTTTIEDVAASAEVAPVSEQ